MVGSLPQRFRLCRIEPGGAIRKIPAAVFSVRTQNVLKEFRRHFVVLFVRLFGHQCDWSAACVNEKLPQLIRHDFRRPTIQLSEAVAEQSPNARPDEEVRQCSVLCERKQACDERAW